MVGRSGGKSWLKLARGVLLALSTMLVWSGLHAGPVRSVILIWEHEPGPFSYNVYEATNLLVTPVQWMHVTNTTALMVQLPARDGEHYFTVSCLDTNTDVESPLAKR
jgi:hypothetical protein